MALPKFDKPLDSPDIPDNDFAPMPEAEYFGVIDEANEKDSAAGNPMLELNIKLAGNEKYNGRFVRYYLVYGNEYPLTNAKKLMMALQQDITGLTQIKAKNLIGLPCKFKTKVSETTKRDDETGEVKVYKNDNVHYFIPIMADDAAVVIKAAGVSGGQSDDGVPDLGDDIPF